MPRKPNYRFERLERDRARAAKKAERAKAKLEKAQDVPPTTDETPASSEPGVESAES